MSSKTRTAVGFVMTVIALMLVIFVEGPVPVVKADQPAIQQVDMTNIQHNEMDAVLIRLLNDVEKVYEGMTLIELNDARPFLEHPNFDGKRLKIDMLDRVTARKVRTETSAALVELLGKKLNPIMLESIYTALKERKDYDIEKVLEICADKSKRGEQIRFAYELFCQRVEALPTPEASALTDRHPVPMLRPVWLLIYREDYPFVKTVSCFSQKQNNFEVCPDKFWARTTSVPTAELVASFEQVTDTEAQQVIWLQLATRSQTDIGSTQLFALYEKIGFIPSRLGVGIITKNVVPTLAARTDLSEEHKLILAAWIMRDAPKG